MIVANYTTYDFTINGDRFDRDLNIERVRNVDFKRDSIANALGLNYEGILKYQSPRSKKKNPTIQEKIVVSSSNGTYLAMSKKSFESKKEVNMSIKKNNSYGENLIAEYFINVGVTFLREVSIMGYNLTHRYRQIKGILSQEAKDLLEELEKAIADFMIFPYEKDEPTIILAINGSLHHKKYDELWTKFQDLGLANMLNFKYVVIDTCCDYANIKNNEKSQKELIDFVDSNFGANMYYGNYKEIGEELKYMKKELASKEIASILRDYGFLERNEILEKARDYHYEMSKGNFNEATYF